MSEVVKVGELAQPIAADRPTGVDLRADLTPNSPYRVLKDLRNKNRSLERRLDEGYEVDPPDWDGVLRNSIEILQSKSKDLEVACWAIEALARTEGFDGLAQGFHLLDALVTQYPEDLYPTPEDGDSSRRLSPLANLNGLDNAEGTLIWPINRIALFKAKDGKEIARWHYKQVLLLESREPEVRQRLIADGAMTGEKIRSIANDAKVEVCRATRRAVEAALAAFNQLQNNLSSHYGADAVPSSGIQTALEECLKIIDVFAGARLSELAPASAAAQGDGRAAAGGNAVLSAPGVVIPAAQGANREQILHAIEQCAQALRVLEPQSMIPAVLERAVRWARLPVDQLLRELIVEDGALSAVTRLTGVSYYTKPETTD